MVKMNKIQLNLKKSKNEIKIEMPSKNIFYNENIKNYNNICEYSFFKNIFT